jgi:hypothetical protein
VFSNNSASALQDNPAPVSVFDWLPEPSPSSKKLRCGQLTQITEYSTGTVGVMAFYCHRHDCLRCGALRRKEIIQTIMTKSKVWYVQTISEDELLGMRKKVGRAGEQYCAVGAGDRILMMTLKPMLQGSHITGLSKLEYLIDGHLDCEYDYRTRRFRHSNGLFPAKPKPITSVHILKQYASSESMIAVVDRFTKAGYIETFNEKGYFLRRSGKGSTVDEVLATGLKHLEWAE